MFNYQAFSASVTFILGSQDFSLQPPIRLRTLVLGLLLLFPLGLRELSAQILQCDQFPGATADLKIKACLTALPTYGGIADLRGFGATTQTIATCPVAIGSSTQTVDVLVGSGTTFELTCSNNPSDYGFDVYAGSHVDGGGAGTTGGPAGLYATFVAMSGSSMEGIFSNSPRAPTGAESVISISNIMLRSNTGSTIGEGLISLAGVYSGTTLTNVGSTYCGGGGSSLFITAPTSGSFLITSDLTFINDNFDCGSASNSGHAVEIKDSGSTAGIGSINFFGSQAQHSGSSEIDINGSGSVQCGDILFSGLHTESATGLTTTPPFVTINDCHNITLNDWNTSGPTPSSGNLVTVAQATTNATHDIFISRSRFLAGTNVVSSSVTGLASLAFTAQPDTAMSLEYYAGLPLARSVPQFIASGTATMTTAAITAGNCGTTVTVAAAGVATTDTIHWSFNSAPAGSNAGLVSWPTSGNVNFAYCPNSAETPAARTINWRVVR